MVPSHNFLFDGKVPSNIFYHKIKYVSICLYEPVAMWGLIDSDFEELSPPAT